MTATNNSQLSQSWWQLCELSEDVLKTWDIAALNLAAAQGLPGLGAVDVAACLDKLDDWAQRVKDETLRHIYRFDPQSSQPPTEYAYGNSFGRFCCYFMLQILQQDCGVVYNPARKFDPDFGDPADVFVHGILDDHGQGGTCASMPIVYVAVGRRLGYPVYLVQTKEHLFFRWEDPRGTLIQWNHPRIDCWIPPDRFNVEGAGEGIAFYPDSHYIQWPHLWKEADFEHERYLRSLTTKEEFADFLIQRGECQWELGQQEASLQAYCYARQLAPDDSRYEWLHAIRSGQCEHHRELERQRLLEVNELNRRSPQYQQPKPVTPAFRIVKISYGTPYPTDLPPGTTVQYVPPEEADVILPRPGHTLEASAGRPLPRNLPPGIGIQVVEPHLVDPLPPENHPLLPPRPNTQMPAASIDAHLERVKRIQHQNMRLIAEQQAYRTLRPS